MKTTDIQMATFSIWEVVRVLAKSLEKVGDFDNHAHDILQFAEFIHLKKGTFGGVSGNSPDTPKIILELDGNGLQKHFKLCKVDEIHGIVEFESGYTMMIDDAPDPSGLLQIATVGDELKDWTLWVRPTSEDLQDLVSHLKSNGQRKSVLAPSRKKLLQGSPLPTNGNGSNGHGTLIRPSTEQHPPIVAVVKIPKTTPNPTPPVQKETSIMPETKITPSTISKLFDAACEQEQGLTKDLIQETRKHAGKDARQKLVSAIRLADNTLSVKEISSLLGFEKDSTTLAALNNGRERYQKDSNFRKDVDVLVSILGGPSEKVGPASTPSRTRRPRKTTPAHKSDDTDHNNGTMSDFDQAIIFVLWQKKMPIPALARKFGIDQHEVHAVIGRFTAEPPAILNVVENAIDLLSSILKKAG